MASKFLTPSQHLQEISGKDRESQSGFKSEALFQIRLT